jgi:hypothetical protein
MPPLKPGKIVNTKGKVVNAPVKKTDSANVREDRKVPNRTSNSSMQARDKARSEGRNKIKPIVYKPDPDPHKKKKKKKSGGTPEPKVVTPTPTTATTPQTNLIDNVNLTKKYNDEIARLTLELISQSESLLLAYDFKGIDFVPSYYLESGDEARNTKIITESNRPVSTEADVNSAELKYNVSNAMNSIIAKIGDGQSAREKYFGSVIPGQNKINPKKATISNNVATFDLEISDILIAGASGFTIKLYEVV